MGPAAQTDAEAQQALANAIRQQQEWAGSATQRLEATRALEATLLSPGRPPAMPAADYSPGALPPVKKPDGAASASMVGFFICLFGVVFGPRSALICPPVLS